MKIRAIDRFDGGWSLVNPRNLEDNQFERLKNLGYNKDKRIQTRRGINPYFAVIPDATLEIHNCDATTNWSVGGDGATLATGAAIRGSNSISFMVDVSVDAGNATTLINSSLVKDITNIKGYISFWLFVPTGFNTDLTAVKVRLGTDASNYYEWTLAALTENSTNFIVLNFADATETGSLNDASITYFRLEITYTAAYTDKSGIRIDAIQAYSGTSNKPVTSYFFNENAIANTRDAFCVAGANMFLWHETEEKWEVINTGLTEFETITGITDHRTRWGFFAFNGSGTLEVGACNGVDNYRKWNGTTITEFAAQPKCRFFLVQNDRIHSNGAYNAPITHYYTNGAPANVNTLNTNDVDIGNELDGVLNGVAPLGQLILCMKDDKVFYVDVDQQEALPIDAESGGNSNRATANVGNGIFIYNKTGIDTLKQKSGATGGAAVEGTPYTVNLRTLFSQIAPNQRNANCGLYIKELTNYYFSFDTGDDNIPETTIVYSSLVGNKNAWSEYTYPAAYQYGYYKDANGDGHFLLCSANSGLIYEIETGFEDDGGAIEADLLTKAWDFGRPTALKSFKAVDIAGLKSEGIPINVELIVGGEVVFTGTITDDMLNKDAAAITIASDPIAAEALGGGGGGSSDDIDIYPYTIRLGGEVFAVGETIQVRMYSDTSPIVWTLDQMQIRYDEEVEDIFFTTNIA